MRSADEVGPPLTVPSAPAREAAERELSQDVYTRHEPGLFRRVWNWVWERLFGALESAAFHTPGGWLGLLVIVLILVAVLVAVRLRLGALRGATGPRAGRALFTDEPLTAAEHRAAAEAHAAAGRWSDAVRERMRALVRALEERALLDPRPGRTATEAAAEAARALPTLAPRLNDAAALFDAVAYGERPATADDHARLAALDDDARRATPDLAAAGWTTP
ncbi:protein of unknown function [Streptomyces zhaozhouensis]|uniref:Protein-glutamine gamma-glutamyltransferase-like C-terminal domain-containing protein n=1 Tax=Streptomyces zhaozhouensis TaxID=1300267 RepID=A0A286E205_9ACTN|nr:DUF4129 domain-containing protein [Streptomyces zhaozhouensis]SOD64919.1 protein of unknown function [Streptomyces zhaozhouensis]